MLNLLSSVLFLRRVNNYNLVAFQTSLSSFFSKDLQDGLVLWYLPCIFTHGVASESTQITVAAWIQGFPQIMIIENTEPTESAITFTAHSTDSDNTVWSSETENCTHGTIATSILQEIKI